MNLRYYITTKTGLNKIFSRRQQIVCNGVCVSPIEATIDYIAVYGEQSIGVKQRDIDVGELLGEYNNLFIGGTIISAYLSPLNKHFWILPQSGEIISIHKNSGTAKFFHTIVGAEKIIKYIPCIRHCNLLQSAISRNATCSYVLKTEYGYIAMIAVGSLGVNHIVNLLEVGGKYIQGIVGGYFELGSSFILLFSKEYTINLKLGRVNLGENIL